MPKQHRNDWFDLSLKDRENALLVVDLFASGQIELGALEAYSVSKRMPPGVPLWAYLLMNNANGYRAPGYWIARKKRLVKQQRFV